MLEWVRRLALQVALRSHGGFGFSFEVPSASNHKQASGDRVNFWMSIAVIAVLSFVAVAIGVHKVVVALAAFLLSIVLIVVSMGGFGRSEESDAMILGFGAMLLIPVGALLLVSMLLGWGSRRKLVSKDFKPLDALAPSPVANSIGEAVSVALAQFRRGSAIKVRCPSCHRKVASKRVLSATHAVPDIELSCACGACNGSHPF